MRRLVLIAAVIALLVPAGATAKPAAHLVVAKGTTRTVGGRLTGSFVVSNRGRATSPRTKATVMVVGSPGELKVRITATITTANLPPLRPGQERRVRFGASDLGRITIGSAYACLEPTGCRKIGRIAIEPRRTPAGAPPSVTTPPSPSPAPQPISTVPTDPIAYEAGTPFEVTSGPVPYWAFVPDSYDAGNQTPAPLLIWLHGCGGESSGDIWVVDPGAEGEPQDWLTIAVGGREGECWTPSVDEAKVLAALADVETHFNVDRRRVILGGYSSGGDLAYRTGFRHSSTFAGLLIENSSPFRDTESSAAESLAAATTRPHIIHLAHSGDATYPLAGVQGEVAEVAAAGFPIELIVQPGTHSDANTDSDLRKYLLPHIDDGWLA
ncbi:MAG TPA: hypothetical protein VGH14_18945 [Solirubrobacterales bacterium]|jgi:predicted esterase